MSTSEVLSIRDLEESELGWLADQEREIFGLAAWSRELLQADFRFGMKRYRVAERGADLVGYAIYGVDSDVFHLMNIAVVGQARGTGVGRALMDDFFAEARRLGLSEVWLEVAVTNEPAAALYRAYGFETVRIRPRYYQPEDVDGALMRASVPA